MSWDGMVWMMQNTYKLTKSTFIAATEKMGTRVYKHEEEYEDEDKDKYTYKDAYKDKDKDKDKSEGEDV